LALVGGVVTLFVTVPTLLIPLLLVAALTLIWYLVYSRWPWLLKADEDDRSS
jgi:hypothetical protein